MYHDYMQIKVVCQSISVYVYLCMYVCTYIPYCLHTHMYRCINTTVYVSLHIKQGLKEGLSTARMPSANFRQCTGLDQLPLILHRTSVKTIHGFSTFAVCCGILQIADSKTTFIFLIQTVQQHSIDIEQSLLSIVRGSRANMPFHIAA